MFVLTKTSHQRPEILVPLALYDQAAVALVDTSQVDSLVWTLRKRFQPNPELRLEHIADKQLKVVRRESEKVVRHSTQSKAQLRRGTVRTAVCLSDPRVVTCVLWKFGWVGSR